MTVEPLATTDDLTLYQDRDPQFLLDMATATVRAYCGWHIAPSMEDTVTIIGGQMTGLLALPSLYVTSVEAVTVAGLLVDPVDYVWTTNGLIRRPSYWRSAGYWTPIDDAAVVEFTHGYDTVPADVLAVVLDLAGSLSSTLGGVSREQAGPFSVQYAATERFLSPAHRTTLDLYRIRVV